MANDGTVVVKTKQGELRGVIEESVYGEKFLAFRGIPYAKPPLGELRFKDPEPPEPWTGIKDASKFGNVCAQYDLIRRQVTGSDDCLYLNVYTKSIDTSALRSVMVWIHGGGFLTGSANDEVYGPDYLVRKDVVIVTCNYRLGILGFLNLEDEVAPGNQGLKDQVMALKWVRENISNFGGDPNNVTIFGESAGAASVHYLTLSPLADGLFHKAIMQSGSAVNPWANKTVDPKSSAFKLVAKLGKETTDPKATVEFLRTIDVTDLIKGQGKLTTKEDEIQVTSPFFPCADHKSPNPFLAEHPSVAMQRGVKVPLILGFNANEGSFLVKNPTDEELKRMDGAFESLVHPELTNLLKQEGVTVEDMKRLYFGNKPLSRETLQNYSDFLSDTYFLRGIFDVVNVQMKKGTPTYLYHFKHDDGKSFMKAFFDIQLPGTAHGEDIIYLFYPHYAKIFNIELPKPGTVYHKIIDYFTQMWTDFAKTGDPIPTTSESIQIKWEPLRSGNVYNCLSIDEQLKMESTEKGAQRFEWKRLKNKL